MIQKDRSREGVMTVLYILKTDGTHTLRDFLFIDVEYDYIYMVILRTSFVVGCNEAMCSE